MKTFSSQQGFTLIEMLVVLIIVSIVMAISSSSTRNPTYRLDKQVSQVVAALRLARSKAVLKTSYAGVKFDVQNNAYRIFDDVGADGLGPADKGYPGPDSGEHNGDYDSGEPTRALVNIGEVLAFGAASIDPQTVTPEGLGTTIGGNGTVDPVPAQNDALVFGPRGKLTTPTAGNPPPYYVYLTNTLRTDVRAIRIDPWTGAVQVYRWNWDSSSWSYL